MKGSARCIVACLAACAAVLGPPPLFSQESSPISGIWKGHEAGITGLAVSPYGARLATSGLDGTVRLWDTASDRTILVLRSRDIELYAVAFSPDGRSILSTGDKGVVTVFDARTGETRRELEGLKGWSADLSISPDGRLAAAWSMDGRILVWEIQGDGKPQALTGEPGRWGMALAWSPDGRLLAAGRAAISLWDVAKSDRLGDLTGHTDFLRSLAFSPDGRLLASAGLDKTVRVWDVPESRELYTLKPEGFVHPSTKGPMTQPIKIPLLAVKFSPEGKMLATAGADRLVRLWEAGTGRFIRSFQGHTMTITALAFTPDGKTLFSAGLDKTIRAWRLD